MACGWPEIEIDVPEVVETDEPIPVELPDLEPVPVEDWPLPIEVGA